MAISVRATSTGPNSFATSTTISLPTGTVANDLTVIVGGFDGATVGNSVSIPAGWTTIGNANGMFACYRKFVALDPTTVTFTTSDSAADWETAAASFIGCDTTTPVDTFNSYFELLSSDRTATYRAPSVGPNYTNDLSLACFVNATSLGDTQTVPAGYSSVVASTAGPSVLIASKQLSSGAQTGDQFTTATHTNQPKGGFQIALHASGDSAASTAPIVTISGIYNVSPVAASITVPLSRIGAQQNDLAVVLVAATAETISTPAGWTQQAAGTNDVYTFTRFFQSGDSDPVFTAAASTSQSLIAFLLRATNGGLSTIDQVHTASGTGSATLATQTPGAANDYLVAMWGQATANGDTWTPSGSLTQEAVVTNGPSLLVQDVQPASVPTGTFTATASGGSHAVFASEILLTPPAGAGPVGNVMSSLIL
jgi:hypothetical protein